MARKRDTKHIPDTEIRVFTDFSASAQLKAIKTDNCSEAGHVVVDIFVVLHSQKEVKVIS